MNFFMQKALVKRFVVLAFSSHGDFGARLDNHFPPGKWT